MGWGGKGGIGFSLKFCQEQGEKHLKIDKQYFFRAQKYTWRQHYVMKRSNHARTSAVTRGQPLIRGMALAGLLGERILVCGLKGLWFMPVKSMDLSCRFDPQPIWDMCRKQTVDVTLIFLSLSPLFSLPSKNQWEGETKMAT